ncbi:RecF/RecN/SMC [Jimgerdemannia flammicorona]|uniref:Structural maintenance of chromosomes protein n=1 Tax=Jimgerdemannia flammicorona TaxID=994334 RepID=A0A433QWK9_9FUNG|nr:RecF/RecN/SMC [Jimgerdemannia flammicorona]
MDNGNRGQEHGEQRGKMAIVRVVVNSNSDHDDVIWAINRVSGFSSAFTLPCLPLPDMYVEELIIEGFKSYAARTHIQGWDPEFNAITGLNGSGKSNVLDAICFVLGISNLSQVRASNLQDLIYKRGQAGVTKASVTIVFNNEDRDKSPVGFEQYKQLTVTRLVLLGGRNKYIVNGHNAQQQAVQNMFQSVQLNINNPHFLIMQGRITKVLNMKPPEILGMIEEAAGTKMFEDRKNKAFATMTKKEKKVEEIMTILSQEIVPKLDQLRAEKRTFLDFQKTESEMERLNRLVIAHDFKKSEDKLSRSGADFEAKKEKISQLKKDVEKLKDEVAHIDGEIRKYTIKKQKEFANGGKFQELENAVKEFSKQLVRVRTQCDLKIASITEEEKNLEGLLANKAETEQTLNEKQSLYAKLQAKFDALKKTYDVMAEQARKNEELLQTLVTGVSAEEGHENGYMEQLQEAKNTASQASTEEEQAKLKISHLKKECKEKQDQANKTERENSGLLKDLGKAKKEKQDLEIRLSKMDWEPNREAELLGRKSAEQDVVAELTEKSDTLSGQLSGLEFQYSNPTPNFDRSTVKGLVAELITLGKNNVDAAMALEVCAGGRLYNVVVDNDTVGSQLLENGKLRKRVTIIPLNKIVAFKASAEKIATAKGVAPGKVDLALTLIGYDHEIQTAMEYIFGNTLICKDADSAKKVTFDKTVRMKSVTFDGDVYDPNGTLSGGSKSQSAGILIKLGQLKEIRAQLEARRKALVKLENELRSSQKVINDYNKLTQDLELAGHRVSLLEEQLNKSTHEQLLQQVDSIKQQLKEREEIVVASQLKRKEALEACRRIESEMNDFKNNKDSKLKELKKKVSASKSELTKNAQNVTNMQREVQILQLEIEQLETDLGANQKDVSNLKVIITQYKNDEKKLKEELSKIKKGHDEALLESQRERDKLSAFDEEIRDLEAAMKQKTAETAEANLEIQKLTHDVERFQKDKQAAQQVVTDMEKKYEWIADNKQYFGQSNTAYDFNSIDVNDAKKALRQLSEKHESMRKKINVKVMNMIDNVEKKEAGLKQMLLTVQKDKHKIEATITSLDNYKKEALEKTWSKVDVDFGAIFGLLLPGNTARLQPPEGQTISDGLEVKVCLGGVWKASLTELSGGQRSLIALSLILSLLQFKPAPMYILDEVDAALDLSHTQNIGTLLRTRFKGSQFIVVSLKEGMFNNANVLFRTRFRDGTSVVEVCN